MNRPDRRRFLSLCARSAAFAAAAPVLVRLAGCRGGQDGSVELRVALADLPEGARVVRVLGDEPVELTRRGDAVTVRSLVCTHQGCTVAWNEAAHEYVCPCHEGRFDAEGRPIYGSPRRPLRRHAARVEGDTVIVDATRDDGTGNADAADGSAP